MFVGFICAMIFSIICKIIDLICFIFNNIGIILLVIGIIISLVLFYIYVIPKIVYYFRGENKSTKREKEQLESIERWNEYLKVRNKKRNLAIINILDALKINAIKKYNSEKQQLIYRYGIISKDVILEDYNLSQEIITFDQSKTVSILGRQFPYELILRCYIPDESERRLHYIDNELLKTCEVSSNEVKTSYSDKYYFITISVYSSVDSMINISTDNIDKIKEIEDLIKAIIKNNKS